MSDRSCGLAIYFHLRGWFSVAVGILRFALDDNFISRLLINALAYASCFRVLPVDLHGELELTRVVRCRGLSCIGEERAHGGHVHFVCDVKHVGDQVEAEALGECDPARDAHVSEGCPRSDPCVAAEVSIELQKRWNRSAGDEAVDARFLECAARRKFRTHHRAAGGIDGCVRTAGQRRELEIVSAARQNVEGRPEEISSNGANVQSLSIFLAKPLPPTFPV